MWTPPTNMGALYINLRWWLNVMDDHYIRSLVLLVVCCHFAPNERIWAHSYWWQWAEFVCSILATTSLCGQPISCPNVMAYIILCSRGISHIWLSFFEVDLSGMPTFGMALTVSEPQGTPYNLNPKYHWHQQRHITNLPKEMFTHA